MTRLTDKELLIELDKRISSSSILLEQQEKLLQELEHVNKQLVESETVKSQFLSNIRNEINNPLTAILGLAKSLANSFNNEVTVIRNGKLIYEEAFDLNFQLNNVFIAAELESGEFVPEIGFANIKELVDQVLEDFKHKSAENKLTVSIENNLENNIYRTDSGKIHTIITNLFSNAIKFNHPNQSIIVKLNKIGQELCITIQDFGIGIELEDQTKIYDRFRQLQSGMTKEYGGHGLGLSIVKELLNLLKGRIVLESELNRGSSFSIFIPEAAEQEDLNTTLGGNEFIFEGGDELF
jgi:signal transduction histidine kinase